jgi:hypothetical protein
LDRAAEQEQLLGQGVLAGLRMRDDREGILISPLWLLKQIGVLRHH